MSEPRGFLLTFRTYGNWLHGDSRGSVDAEHNAFNTAFLATDRTRRRFEQSALKQPPMEFDAAQRTIVEAALRDKCAFRNWPLLALAVRTNHVHGVLEYAGVMPEKMIGELKAWATRALRAAGAAAADRSIWADGVGSRRYLWRDVDVNAAIAYVLEGQDVPR